MYSICRNNKIKTVTYELFTVSGKESEEKKKAGDILCTSYRQQIP